MDGDPIDDDLAPTWLLDFVSDEVRPFLLCHKQEALAALERYVKSCEEQLRAQAAWDRRLEKHLRKSRAKPEDRWRKKTKEMVEKKLREKKVWVYGSPVGQSQIFGCWGPLDLHARNRPTDVDPLPLPPPRNRDLTPDEGFVALLVIHDRVRDAREMIGPSDSLIYLVWKSCVNDLSERDLRALRRIVEVVKDSLRSESAQGQFSALSEAANKIRLAGNERTIIEEICKRYGRVPLSSLATLLEWNAPFDGTWNAARGRLNKKLKKFGWQLNTHNREAVAEEITSSARK
ncbi:MAG: hypothetical protein U0791_10925 [Gemmataceae bacterium]